MGITRKLTQKESDVQFELKTREKARNLQMSDYIKPSLTYDHSPVFGFPMATSLLSKDRITIIDCKGTCGVSSPTTALVLPENAASIETWNDLYPHSWFSDSPHVDVENEKEEDKTLDYKQQMGMKKYSVRDGVYCY